MSLKIIFMGTAEFAVPILKSLYDSKHTVQSVFTKPPRKKNRGHKVISSPISQFAEKNNITVRTPTEFNETEYNFIKNLKPDIVVVVAYGKLIPENILDLNNCLFINIHASLLPRWRGAAPIQRAIMNLDQETGISIMKIAKELDTGPVMQMIKTPILPETTFESLSSTLSKMACKAILSSLDLIENKKVKFINQDNEQATYAKKIEKSETRIEWRSSAKKIIAKINALYPVPGSWFEMNQMRIKILKAKEVDKKGKPGEIINKNFTVACSDKAIQILELRQEGKKSMKSKDFLSGNKLEVGKILNGI